MAVYFEEKIKRSGEEWTPFPEQLVIAPELNGRHDSPELESLIQSILTVGQIQPCLVRRQGGQMVLAAGFNRWRAISEINKRNLWASLGKKEPFRVRCSYQDMSEVQGFIANIHENRRRNPVTPMDDAYNIQRLLGVYQMSEDEVCNVYGESLAWVKGRLALIEATPAVEKQIRAGKIKGAQAKAIAKLKKEQQDALAAVAEENGKVTPSDIAVVTGKPVAAKADHRDKLLDYADAMYSWINENIGELPEPAVKYAQARRL